MLTRLAIPALGFALIWVVAASIAGDTTFHLAPAITAAAPAVGFPDRRLAAGLAGTANAVAVAIGLSVSG